MLYLFNDYETSGLLKPCPIPIEKQPHSIEYYGCLVDAQSLEIVSEFDTLIKPPIQITAEITKITGITNEMVADAPRFAQVADEIEKQFNSASRMVAHNASYEREITTIEFKRLGREIKMPRVFCTVEQTYHLLGHRQKLGDLHELLFGEKFSGAHRAREDVHALLRCYKELINRVEIA